MSKLNHGRIIEIGSLHDDLFKPKETGKAHLRNEHMPEIPRISRKNSRRSFSRKGSLPIQGSRANLKSMPSCTEPCDPEGSPDGSGRNTLAVDESLNRSQQSAYVGGRQLSTRHLSANNTPRTLELNEEQEETQQKPTEESKSRSKEQADDGGFFGLLKKTFSNVHEKIRKTIYNSAEKKKSLTSEQRARSHDRTDFASKAHLEYATSGGPLFDRPRQVRMQSYYSTAAYNPLTGAPLGTGGSFAGRATSGVAPRSDSSDAFTSTMVENKLMMPHPTRRGFFNFGEEMKSFTEAPANKPRTHPPGAIPSVNIDLRVKVAKVALPAGRAEDRRSGSREAERKTANLLATRTVGGRNSHMASTVGEAATEGFAGSRFRSISFQNQLNRKPLSATGSEEEVKMTRAQMLKMRAERGPLLASGSGSGVLQRAGREEAAKGSSSSEFEKVYRQSTENVFYTPPLKNFGLGFQKQSLMGRQNSLRAEECDLLASQQKNEDSPRSARPEAVSLLNPQSSKIVSGIVVKNSNGRGSSFVSPFMRQPPKINEDDPQNSKPPSKINPISHDSSITS